MFDVLSLASPRHLATGLLAGSLSLAAAPLQAGPPALSSQGFLYGRVATRNDSTYEGRLRWGTEEAFWSDLFNSSKEEQPYEDDVPKRHRSRSRPLKILGVTIGIHAGEFNRQFVARFGDIRKIEVKKHDDAVVLLKSGTRVPVHGGSNDIGARISVWDRAAGEVKLKWNNIETIEFLPTPADLAVTDFRLHGTVFSKQGEFKGYIQWDQDECLSSDKLDGETDDGKVALEMGQIRTIERRTRRSSRVVLKDGREMVLSGTNDVDSDNRGIFVDDPRYGRVLVSWAAFEKAEFDMPPGSGPSYNEFPPGQPLTGTVTDSGGKAYRGRIVYDVDESETTEFLDGERRDVTYHIPLSLVSSIIPTSSGSASRVILKSGEELKLEDAADVDDDNAGMLIFEEGKERPSYVPWDDVKRVDFSK